MNTFIAAAFSAILAILPLAPMASAGNTPVMKIAVFADGRLTADGRQVTIEELSRDLAQLRKEHGSVLYYREDASSEPPPIATQVIKAIIDAHLPVSLSTKPDFSNVVLPNGSTRPR